MKKFNWPKSRVILALLCLVWHFHATSATPFWKKKEKAYERIENGEILVSVRSAKLSTEPSRKKLHLEGGGQTKVARAGVFAIAQEYERLPGLIEYIKRAKYDADKKQLTMDVEAFSYSATLVAEVTPHVDSEPWRLNYKIVSGPMTGMTGDVTFFAMKPMVTDVGIDGEYVYSKFPIPSLFLTFGMEVMLKRMAFRLREFVEQESHKTSPQGAPGA